MKKRLFMCGPGSFDVVYELSTNEHMNKQVRPNKEEAAIQWARLAMRCADLAETHIALPHPELPDQVFFANAGLPYKDLLIMSNFYHEERRRETYPNLNFFENHFHPKNILILGEGAFFEGQGDAAWINEETLIVGYGIRTNLKGVKEVERVLTSRYPKVKVVPILMKKQSRYYHLDTCQMRLAKAETSLVYPGAFEAEGLAELKKIGKVVMVTDEEARNFPCNGLVVNDETVFVPWANDRLRAVFEAFGYGNVETFAMSEFMKSGGAAKCLVLEHDFPIRQ